MFRHQTCFQRMPPIQHPGTSRFSKECLVTKTALKFARTKKSHPKSEPKMSTATRPMKRRIEDEILSDDEFESGDSRLDDESAGTLYSGSAADEEVEADLELELDADLEAPARSRPATTTRSTTRSAST